MSHKKIIIYKGRLLVAMPHKGLVFLNQMKALLNRQMMKLVKVQARELVKALVKALVNKYLMNYIMKTMKTLWKILMAAELLELQLKLKKEKRNMNFMKKKTALILFEISYLENSFLALYLSK